LKSKAHDYFQSLHYNAWAGFKVAYIEQDSWQRMPVARSYSLIRKDRAQAVPSRKEPGTAGGGAGGVRTDGPPKVRTAESNPFRNYKPESLVPPSSTSFEDGGLGAGRGTDEIDEHALLQHWIDDNESLPHEQIGSSMLSNSNRSPVVSSATVELARLLERYFRMMGALPQLAPDIFQSATQLVDFYVHSVLCLFVQDRHLRAFLEDLDTGQGMPEKLQQRHDALLLQRMCPELRRAVARSREFMSSLSLPDSCAATLSMQAPVTGAAFLQLTPFPKLTSPGSLCGLSERCVGVESVAALLGDLKDLRSWVADLLPRAERDAVDRFLASQEVIAGQLRTIVLRCAASDILEVPHVGRVSLDHFSNTMQALKWEARDFSSGSPGAPYVEQLRAQIDELARRIPCAGGGSIPYATQRIVWGWMEVRIMQECAEVIAKCGRKKTPEAIMCLAKDFQSIKTAAQQNFRQAASDSSDTEELQLLPAEHTLLTATQWVYLDQYLEAHGYSPNEIAVWCKRHPEYPLRLHKAVIEYLHASNQRAQRQLLSEFEVFLAGYISDAASEFGSGRGI